MNLLRGAHVTIISTGCVRRAIVKKQRRGEIVCTYALFPGTFPCHTFTVRRRDEGITWARGHTGPAVDALRVAAALGPFPTS